MMHRRQQHWLLCASLALAAPTAAEAQPRRSLAQRVGVEAAERLLTHHSSELRRIGIERLGSIGSPRALHLLIASLEPGGPIQTSEDRLLAAHSLAAYAPDHPEARRALVRMMAGVGSSEQDARLEPLVKQTAALALSASRSHDAYSALGSLLKQRGPIAALARDALLAHPPRRLRVLLEAPGSATPELVETLEGLGDQRAFGALRQLVTQTDTSVRAGAALALTRLGHFETVELARHWLKQDGPPELVRAALTILTLAQTSDAPQALHQSLQQAALQPHALKLSQWQPDPQLESTLLSILERAPTVTSSTPLLRTLASMATPKALSAVGNRIDETAIGLLAAYALALAEDNAAGELLEQKLKLEGLAQRNALRGLVLRERLLGNISPDPVEQLAHLANSKVASERAVIAWARATMDAEYAAQAMRSTHSEVVTSAAPAVLFDVAAARAAAEQMSQRESQVELTALAIALVRQEAAALVPNAVLERLLSSPAAAPMAVLELARRDTDANRTRLQAWLSGGDPDIRASAALGLGSSPHPDSIARLAAAWRFEANSRVRGAILRGLSWRKEPTRSRALRLAARLDPDATNRALARRALQGMPAELLPKELGATVVHIGPGRSARLELESGLTLPAVADPDGIIAALGLSRDGLDVHPMPGP